MVLQRLSKIMAQRGLCSRREADEWIKAGLVMVNGNLADLKHSMFHPDVEITVAHRIQQQQKNYLNILLHKPVGIVSSQPVEGETPAIHLLTKENFWDPSVDIPCVPRYQPKLAVAGRLDKDSRGLLLFTQDGRIAKQVIGENSKLTKRYIVTVREPVTRSHIQALRSRKIMDGTY